MTQYPEPSEREIELVAGELQKVAYTSQWERVLAIGGLIFSHFFHDDEEAWRERRRNKDRSIRKLAERVDCPYGKSALTEAVGIHVFCAKYPETRSSMHISPTHVGKTLGLDPERAVELLRRAGRECWSVRQVATEATSMRRMLGERRGRPVSLFDQRAERCGRHAAASLVEMRECLEERLPLDAISNERFGAMCRTIEEALEDVRALLSPSKSGQWRLGGLAESKSNRGGRKVAVTRSGAA